MTSSLPLLAQCSQQVSERLADFEAMPTSGALCDLSVVAETLLVSGQPQAFAAVAHPLATGVADWVRSGLLHRILMAHAQHYYDGAVLIHLAAKEGALSLWELSQFARAMQHKLIGRSELSALTLAATLGHLAEAGSVSPLGPLKEDIRRCIDKRVLRRRADEHDVLALMQTVCLAQLGYVSSAAIPVVLPQVMLLQSMRKQQLNWMATLALVVARLNGTQDALACEALNLLASCVTSEDVLLPAPLRNGTDDEFLARSEVGLRLRATLAYCALQGRN